MGFSINVLKVVFIIQLLLSVFAKAEAQVITEAWLRNAQSKTGDYLMPMNSKYPEKFHLHVYAVEPIPGKLPPFELVQGDFIQSGVMKYLRKMDVMDRDLFYMKLKDKDRGGFLKMTKVKEIPEKNALDLYKLIHRSHFAAIIAVKDAKGKEISFKNIKRPLKKIKADDGGYQFFLEKSVLKWNHGQKTFSEELP